jgi:nucleoredoxin
MEQFPTIRSSAKIIGLYFCASWCPDCIAATPKLVKIIEASNDNDTKTATKFIDVFYISSDRSIEEMNKYKPSCFSEVHYSDVDLRTSLKKHFGTCAMKEVSELGMNIADRKHGVPTLILIDNKSGRVLTENGLSYGSSASSQKVLSDWQSLL